jgi:hypothetical protein
MKRVYGLSIDHFLDEPDSLKRLFPEGVITAETSTV